MCAPGRVRSRCAPSTARPHAPAPRAFGTGETCPRLGIAHTTGYLRRGQRGGLLRTVLPEDSQSGNYLSLLERERIANLRAQGCGVREIGRRLNRVPSTISRELVEICAPATTGSTPPVWDTRELGSRRVVTGAASSPETIYQGLHYGGNGDLSRTLTKNLRTGRGVRRRSARSRRPRFAAHCRMIDEHPAEASARKRNWRLRRRPHRRPPRAISNRHAGLPGHRFVRLVHVPDRRRGEDFAAALAATVR
ncbi:helix-turn-helix domain-containing protein [Rhodococcus sp. NCIMB 12038]|uniref:helix-turn-helix domain-containing protein n=1 Tax=Rhodococcus sp. NCIMB 12038 TaxID=933800 RepID=UPI000B555B24|nr:hypothetical protein CA951_42515 [Rhodococcus sp. NCIMB 12038]